MKNLISGTIVIAIRRANYCILATDSLAVQGDPMNPVSVAYHDKIVLHDRLPIAVAIGGMGSFDDPSDPENPLFVANIVTDIFSSMTHESQITNFIVDTEKRILPMVEERLRAKADSGDPLGSSHLDLVVAANIGGKSMLTNYTFKDHLNSGKPSIRSQEFEVGGGFMHKPESLGDFYASYTLLNPGTIGSQSQSSFRMATHVRKAVQGGIEHERSLNCGVNRRCGGDARVAIVDATSARFVN